MDIEKVLDYLQRKTADMSELHAASVIMQLCTQIAAVGEMHNSMSKSFFDQREQLITAQQRIAELEKQLKIITTKAIACEMVAEKAVRNAQSWPPQWAMQPTAAEFVNMAYQQYEKEMADAALEQKEIGE